MRTRPVSLVFATAAIVETVWVLEGAVFVSTLVPATIVRVEVFSVLLAIYLNSMRNYRIKDAAEG